MRDMPISRKQLLEAAAGDHVLARELELADQPVIAREMLKLRRALATAETEVDRLRADRDAILKAMDESGYVSMPTDADTPLASIVADVLMRLEEACDDWRSRGLD